MYLNLIFVKELKKMGKYFLLSAVALLAANNANADNSSITVEAHAKIEHVSEITCSPLDFGTIYLKKNNVESIVHLNDTPEGDVVHVSGNSPSRCEGIEDGATIIGFNDDSEGVYCYADAFNPDEEALCIRNIRMNFEDYIFADLYIPANFPEATFDTTIQFTIAY